MKVFLDANVLVSILNKEYPTYSFSAKLVSLAGKQLSLCTSPLCLAIAFYFASKKCGEELAKTKIGILCDHMEITEIGPYAVKQSLTNKMVQDLEDGFEYFSAIAHGCNYLVTEDIHDFYFADISVMNCKSFLEHYFEKYRS